ncbi:MAG: hypothetical protein ACOCV2_11555 [Persicimonas sp.]
MRMLSKIGSISFLGVLATTLLMAGGCDTTIEGEEGNLSLEYDRGAMLEATGGLPLAVDARLDYAAFPQSEEDEDPEDRNYVTFTDAMSSDDEIIMVEENSGESIELAGRGDGEAIIDVDAEDVDEEEVSDSFEVEAATVEELEIEHACDSDEALYQAGQDVQLHYRMLTDDDLRAVGTGYYPVEFDPSDGAEVGETDVNGLLPVSLGDEPGTVVVDSTLDDASLEITAVEEADIDDVDIEGASYVENGDASEVYLMPSSDGSPVCQTDLQVDVTTDSDDVCAVNYGEAEEHRPIRPLYEPNALLIETLEEGTCEFSVELPEADDGNGVEADFSVEVTEE